MQEPASPSEWDQLVVKMGTLTLAVGNLEMAIIAMVCHIVDQAEEKIGWLTNNDWCKKFIRVAPASWSDEERKRLAQQLEKVRELYRRRNRVIHATLGVAGDGLIAGVPAGSVIDLRTYGLGFTRQEGNAFVIGFVGERFDLSEIDQLTTEVQEARIALVPYMQLVDKIKHPSKSSFPMPMVGKRF